jgi:PDZ domain-containing secreted protein
MKKVILAILFLSVFSYTESCNFQDLNTKDDIEEAQQCMINQLEELDKYFARYDDYHVSYKETFQKLINQEGNCKKWRLLYDRTKNDDYKISVDDCEALYLERLKKYRKVSKQFNRISIHYEKLKENKEALELKENTLKNVADMLGVKN